MGKETISLKELVGSGRITHKGGKPLPDYDLTWIAEHGGSYEVSPRDVRFTLIDEYGLYPSVQLEKVILNGVYTVTRDILRINMGMKGYELHDRPIGEFVNHRDKITTVEFKRR